MVDGLLDKDSVGTGYVAQWQIGEIKLLELDCPRLFVYLSLTFN